VPKQRRVGSTKRASRAHAQRRSVQAKRDRVSTSWVPEPELEWPEWSPSDLERIRRQRQKFKRGSVVLQQLPPKPPLSVVAWHLPYWLYPREATLVARAYLALRDDRIPRAEKTFIRHSLDDFVKGSKDQVPTTNAGKRSKNPDGTRGLLERAAPSLPPGRPPLARSVWREHLRNLYQALLKRRRSRAPLDTLGAYAFIKRRVPDWNGRINAQQWEKLGAAVRAAGPPYEWAAGVIGAAFGGSERWVRKVLYEVNEPGNGGEEARVEYSQVDKSARSRRERRRPSPWR
jgi:hypothetical protein